MITSKGLAGFESERQAFFQIAGRRFQTRPHRGFGSTKRARKTVEDDQNIRFLLEAKRRS
jgi:hypothetical protein